MVRDNLLVVTPINGQINSVAVHLEILDWYGLHVHSLLGLILA